MVCFVFWGVFGLFERQKGCGGARQTAARRRHDQNTNAPVADRVKVDRGVAPEQREEGADGVDGHHEDEADDIALRVACVGMCVVCCVGARDGDSGGGDGNGGGVCGGWCVAGGSTHTNHRTLYDRKCTANAACRQLCHTALSAAGCESSTPHRPRTLSPGTPARCSCAGGTESAQRGIGESVAFRRLATRRRHTPHARDDPGCDPAATPLSSSSSLSPGRWL